MNRYPQMDCAPPVAVTRRWTEPGAGAPLPLIGMVLLSTWAGLAAAAVHPPATPAAGPTHGFNFAYQPEGARLAAPTQVFDDGHRTYLQFNALDRVPELWTDDPVGRVANRPIRVHLESPYIVIDQVLPRLRLVLDGADTVLVNQAWRGRPPGQSNAGAPSIWSDHTRFGPEELPGPVAAMREALPSRDAVPVGQGGVAGRAAPQPVAALGERLPPARSLSDPDPERASLPAPSAAAERPPGAEGATVPGAPTSVNALENTIVDRIADARLDALRGRAMDMIARAHAAGDRQLESRLRMIFRDLSLLSDGEPPAAPGQPGRPQPHQRPPAAGQYALAETRARSDVPVQDGSDVPLPATPANPAAETGAAAHAPQGGRPEAGLTFEVRDNQRLSQALAQFLEARGWRLEWESQSDFLVRRGYVVQAPTLKQILLQALGGYRLSAVIYSGNLVVAVSGGEP